MAPEPWRDLISPKVGVVRSMAPQLRGADEPLPPHLYTATLSHFDFRSSDRSERVAAGKGLTERDAMMAALGEALERYCGHHWDPHRTYLARADALPRAAVTPAECVLYAPRQYAGEGWPYHAWDPAQQVTWIDGTELPGNLPVALPASLTYLVFPVPRSEDFFAPATSNGLAAGPTLEAAVLSGLCEVIERDAMLVAWMNRLPAVELDLAHASAGAAAAIHRVYDRLGVTLRAFLLPSDLPASVVMAMALDPDPAKPATVVGLGCHPSPAIALTKAVFELCQGRPSEARRFADKPPQGRLVRYEDVRTLDDHSAFASLAERRDEFTFLWRHGSRARIADLPDPSLGSVGADLARCAERLAMLGCRVAYAELTTSDVAGRGFHVVRVIATQLQPIHFGHGQERLGGRRLYELPQRLGLADAPTSADVLNPCPHPLA